METSSHIFDNHHSTFGTPEDTTCNSKTPTHHSARKTLLEIQQTLYQSQLALSAR